MTDLCTQCGEHLVSPAIFCARCGARVSKFETEAEIATEHLAAEKAPVTGAFSGLYFGLIAMPLLLIVGIMLCLTGLGIVFGLPMIVMAIFAPLAGPLLGMGAGKDDHPDSHPASGAPSPS